MIVMYVVTVACIADGVMIERHQPFDVHALILYALAVLLFDRAFHLRA